MDQPAASTNKNADEDAEALAAVEQHHAGMLKRLSALTATLVRAVRTGDTVAEHDAHEVLVEWCETDLVPHALAEEGPLYSAPRNLPQVKLLVDGMLAEHQVIVGLVEDLRGSTGVDAAAIEETDSDVLLRSDTIDVQKQARVTGEVVVSKEAVERTERVSDMVRREEVYVDEDATLIDETAGGSSRSG